MSRSTYGLILPARYQTEQTHQGGAAYTSDVWTRLTRVLLLGTDHNTFYVGKNDLTEQGIATIQEAIDTDPIKTAKMVQEIAKNRRALKQDPAIVALSMLVSQGDGGPVDPTAKPEDMKMKPLTAHEQLCRSWGYSILPDVIQIPTNLFMFLNFVLKQRGWSMGLKVNVARWIERTPADKLAYWAIKYQQRDGMSFHDVLKMAHPKAPTPAHAVVYDWISGRTENANVIDHPQLHAANTLKLMETVVGHDLTGDAAALIRLTRLPREIVPTAMLNRPEIWDALLVDMPVWAMIRNLGKMTNVGLITRKSGASRTVRDRLLDPDRLKGLHPLALVIAMKQYEAGHGDKGSLRWTPDVDLVDALDEAFYLALGQLTAPAGNHIYAVDESGSMGGQSGVSNLTCREAAAVMAMAAAHAHKGACEIVAFDTELRSMPVSQRQRLTDVTRMLRHGGGTDCSLPLLLAAQTTEPINGVTVFTDGADGVAGLSWGGGSVPFSQAFQRARKPQPTLKAAAVAMAPYKYQLTQPDHPDMLSVVGLDTAVPDLLRTFYDGGLA